MAFISDVTTCDPSDPQYAQIRDARADLPNNYFSERLIELAVTADFIRLKHCQAWEDEFPEPDGIEHPTWLKYYEDNVPNDFDMWWRDWKSWLIYRPEGSDAPSTVG